MNRYIIIVLIAFLFVTGSCTGRKNKAEHKDIIPEKDLTSILMEVHIADGLLTIPEIRYKFNRVDTLSAYIDIIKKYGYTKSQMDRTMRYYFIRKPKKLIKIYDKVLGQLSAMESRIDKELQNSSLRQMSIWPGKQFYSFPDPGNIDTTWVDFASDFYGTLTLKFTLTIYPDDQSGNPYLGLYFSKTDTTGDEKTVSFPHIPLIKDGRPHDYNINLVQKFPGTVKLKGWFIDQQGASPGREYHHRVENIVLTRNMIVQ